MSWLLHGFFSLNGAQCCGDCQLPPDGSTLGVHCSSPNTAARTGTQSGLGPRWQINASTGAFPFPAANPPFAPNIARRLQARIVDVDPAQNPGALYYVEKICVSDSDAAAGNQVNNCSWRPVSFTVSSNEPVIALSGFTHALRPAIDAWRD